MPFVDRNNQPIAPEQMTAQTPYGVRDGDSTGETPSYGETLKANFRVNNWVTSEVMSNRDVGSSTPFDSSFDPWKSIEGTPYEQHWGRFVDARNGADFENIKKDIDAETQAKDVLSRSSLFANLSTGLAAGIVDPLTLIPGVGVVRNARMGVSIARTALLAGASAMGQASIQEALLHASQQTRTLDESAWNVLGAGVVGTVLGAGFARAIGASELHTLGGRLMDDMHAGPPSHPDLAAVDTAVMAVRDHQAAAMSAGAASAPVPELKDLGVSNAIANGVLRAAPITPIARALAWKSPEARSMFLRLAENSVYLTGTESGKTTGPAVENLIHQWRGQYDLAYEQHFGAYKDYVKAGGRFSRADFNEAVSMAMRRGDTSNVPGVARSAQAWRQLERQGTSAAQKAGLLPEDLHVSTAPSYFTRVWDRRKLTGEEFEFKDVVKNYLRPLSDPKAFENPGEFESNLDDIANNVFDKLTGRGGTMADDFQKITVGGRGPLKERTFNIPDHLVERWLDNDVERVMGKFSRILGADVEISNAFPDSVDLGTKRVTLHGPLQKVTDDYRKLREEVAANDKLNPAQRAKALKSLSKEEESALEDLGAMRDQLRGTYSVAMDAKHPTFAKVSRIANTFNYIRTGGGFVASSLTDIARPMMTAGTMSHYLQGLTRFATDANFRAISRQEAKRAGTVGETAKYARLASWAEMTDPYGQGTAFERFAQNSNRVMTRASGIALWNDWAKTFSAALTESRITKNIMNDWEKIPERERRYMTYIGIDKDMAERMRYQVEAPMQGGAPSGGKKGDFWHSGTDTWTDETAKRTFWAALDKDVNSTIVTPGVADLPLFMHSPIGKMLLQYKSFTIASHQKALVRAIQEGANGSQAAVLMGVMGAISIGMFISVLKAIEGNRMDQLSDNPGKWLAEGVDRSGMLSILMEAGNTAELLRGQGKDKYPVGVTTGLESLFPDAQQSGGASRFASRGVLGQLLGPSAGTFDDMTRIFGWSMDSARKPVGAKAALALLPGRTLPYVRPFLEYGLKPYLDEGQQ